MEGSEERIDEKVEKFGVNEIDVVKDKVQVEKEKAGVNVMVAD